MPAAKMPFVGRREEMAALEDEFARAAAGEFRVVLLSGEAGVGKSRLSRELLARHPEAAGMFARAHPLGVTAAFGVWAEAIDPLLRDRPNSASPDGSRFPYRIPGRYGGSAPATSVRCA